MTWSTALTSSFHFLSFFFRNRPSFGSYQSFCATHDPINSELGAAEDRHGPANEHDAHGLACLVEYCDLDFILVGMCLRWGDESITL